MNELDQKKKELQIIKANASIAELEYKILERYEDIKRMQNHIQKQNELINKLQGE